MHSYYRNWAKATFQLSVKITDINSGIPEYSAAETKNPALHPRYTL
jgi:hypothetical protein